MGFTVDPVKFTRLVDRGPSLDAENSPEGQQFLFLWGELAQLRRFKDGMIVFSVVWDSVSARARHLIVEEAIIYLCNRHIPELGHPIVYAGQLDSFLEVGEDPNKTTPVLVTALDELADLLKRLNDMPVSIASLLPADTGKHINAHGHYLFLTKQNRQI